LDVRSDTGTSPWTVPDELWHRLDPLLPPLPLRENP